MTTSNERQSSPEPFEFSVSSSIDMLFRHKKKIILLPLLSIGVGALIVFFFPRTYASEAKLYLQVGARESVGLDPTATTGQTISLMQSSREDEVKSAIELMTSRGVIAKVVDRLTPDVVLGKVGPGQPKQENAVAAALKSTVGRAIKMLKDIDPVSPAEEAAIEVERHLEASAERGSTIIVCKYESSTPELAQQILNAVLEEYQLEHVRIHRNQGSLEFFVQQCETLKVLLEEKTQALCDKKNELGLGSVEGRRGSLEQQLQQIDLNKYQTEQDLATAQANIGDLQEKLNDEPARTTSVRRMVPNAGADLMRDQLYSLKVKEKELRARYSDSHPMLAAIQEQVEAAQAVVDEEVGQREETTDDINIIHQQLTLQLRQEQGRLAGLTSRLKEISDQRVQVLADLRKLNADDMIVAELEREASVVRNNWMQYTENLEQTRIDQQREENRVSNVSMAQAATLSHKPVSPSKMLVGLASLLLASAGTLAAVVASERLNRNLRTCAQVESALGIPLVGQVARSGEQRRVWATQ